MCVCELEILLKGYIYDSNEQTFDSLSVLFIEWIPVSRSFTGLNFGSVIQRCQRRFDYVSIFETLYVRSTSEVYIKRTGRVTKEL